MGATDVEAYHSQLLFQACKSGDRVTVHRQMTLTDLQTTDHKGKTALHVAVEANHVPVVLTLIGQLDLDSRARDGSTALVAACQKGYETTVNILLQYGADVNLVNNSGWSALSKACYHGHVNIVNLLLEHPAIDVNAYNNYSALHWAVDVSTDQIVKLLITKRRNLKLDVFDACGRTPLHIACGLREMGVTKAKELIQAGADVNCLNSQKETPLHLCCMDDSSDIANALLKRSANVNAEDAAGNSPLHVAISKSSQQCIKLLISHWNIDLEKSDSYGRTPLLMACELELKTLMCDLIKKGADVNASDRERSTPLITLVTIRNRSMVDTLLNSTECVWLNVKGPDDKTALNIACENGHISVISLLLQKGASVNQGDYKGRAPLFWMSAQSRVDLKRFYADTRPEDFEPNLGSTPMDNFLIHNRLQLLDELIELNADVNCAHLFSHVTPLHVALYGDQEDVAERLARAIENVNARDQCQGSTALALAAEKGYVEVVTILLQRGANCEVTDDEGRTPLHRACSDPSLLHCGDDRRMIDDEQFGHIISKRNSGHHAEVVTMLLEARVKLNTEDLKGRTALHYAAEVGDTRVLKLLIVNAADINKADREGRTPLHIIAESGNKDIVSMLMSSKVMSRRVRVNMADGQGRTALHHAAGLGSRDIMELLLSKRMKVNGGDGQGRTALHYAAWAGNKDIVTLLLDRRVNRNAKDNQGRTAFHIAVMMGHKEVVGLLLDRRVKVNDIDINGHTAFDHASEQGDTDMMNLLVERGADVTVRGNATGCLANRSNHSEEESGDGVCAGETARFKPSREPCAKNDTDRVLSVKLFK